MSSGSTVAAHPSRRIGRRGDDARVLINTVNASAYGFTLAEPPGWLDAPSLQTPVVPMPYVPNRGPLVMGASIIQAKRVTLRGHVRGSSAANVRLKLDGLKLALAVSPTKIVFDDALTRYHSLYLESLVVTPRAQGSFRAKDLRVDMSFLAAPPSALDVTETTIADDAPLLLGTAPLRPVVTLLDADDPVLTLRDKDGNAVTSLFLFGSGTIVVDHDTLTITVDGDADMAAIDSGDFFVIDPSDPKYGGSGPTITATGVSSHSTTYRRTWL